MIYNDLQGTIQKLRNSKNSTHKIPEKLEFSIQLMHLLRSPEVVVTVFVAFFWPPWPQEVLERKPPKFWRISWNELLKTRHMAKQI